MDNYFDAGFLPSIAPSMTVSQAPDPYGGYYEEPGKWDKLMDFLVGFGGGLAQGAVQGNVAGGLVLGNQQGASAIKQFEELERKKKMQARQMAIADEQLALEKRRTESSISLDKLRGELTEEQIGEAQRAAEEFMKSREVGALSINAAFSVPLPGESRKEMEAKKDAVIADWRAGAKLQDVLGPRLQQLPGETAIRLNQFAQEADAMAESTGRAEGLKQMAFSEVTGTRSPAEIDASKMKDEALDRRVKEANINAISALGAQRNAKATGTGTVDPTDTSTIQRAINDTMETYNETIESLRQAGEFDPKVAEENKKIIKDLEKERDTTVARLRAVQDSVVVGLRSKVSGGLGTPMPGGGGTVLDPVTPDDDPRAEELKSLIRQMGYTDEKVVQAKFEEGIRLAGSVENAIAYLSSTTRNH